MVYAQDQFTRAVASSEIQTPRVPIIGNVNAKPLLSIEHVQSDLRAQLNSRVRWTESIQYLLSSGITTFVEIGSNSVLTGLLKRIDRSAQGISFGAPQDLDKIAVL
jgi:[acyl-carrier-protein] S-malonyltransferase